MEANLQYVTKAKFSTQIQFCFSHRGIWTNYVLSQQGLINLMSWWLLTGKLRSDITFLKMSYNVSLSTKQVGLCFIAPTKPTAFSIG